MSICLAAPPPPYDPDLPRASICLWPYDRVARGEPQHWLSVLEIYLDNPEKVHAEIKHQYQRSRHGIPMWEPIREIMEYEHDKKIRSRRHGS